MPIPPDIMEAIQTSGYPGEATLKLAMWREITFAEAYVLVERWADEALNDETWLASIAAEST
jgi:hypothetical protein